MTNPFEQSRERKNEDALFESLREIEGVVVLHDSLRIKGAYMLQFYEDGSVTTVRVTLEDESGADLAITNMTVLPINSLEKETDVRNKGYGSKAVQKIIEWAQQKGYRSIVATQVQASAQTFWKKNGFVYDERENNISEDWIYQRQGE